jgi:hypothetical protein
MSTVTGVFTTSATLVPVAPQLASHHGDSLFLCQSGHGSQLPGGGSLTFRDGPTPASPISFTIHLGGSRSRDDCQPGAAAGGRQAVAAGESSRLLADEPREALGDQLITALRCVLVQERGVGSGVAESGLEVGECRSLLRGHHGASVAEVVEAEV